MSQERVKCQCGWTIVRKGSGWTHPGAGTVYCPPQAMWSDPEKFTPNAKATPA